MEPNGPAAKADDASTTLDKSDIKNTAGRATQTSLSHDFVRFPPASGLRRTAHPKPFCAYALAKQVRRILSRHAAHDPGRRGNYFELAIECLCRPASLVGINVRGCTQLPQIGCIPVVHLERRCGRTEFRDERIHVQADISGAQAVSNIVGRGST